MTERTNVNFFASPNTSIWTDLLLISGINLLFFFFFVEIDLLESLYALSRSREELEIDEIFALAITMTISLAVFSFRRWYEMHKMSRIVNELATRDTLTGLFNRHVIEKLISQESDRLLRNQPPYSLLLLDIDHFKQVNDLYGHKQGDELLQQIAHLLLLHTRNVDAVGRWGGEEFLVLLPDTNDVGALQMAERLRQIIAAHPSGLPQPTTVSLGVATAVAGESYNSLFQRLDNALYKAKSSGRNRSFVSPAPPAKSIVIFTN